MGPTPYNAESKAQVRKTDRQAAEDGVPVLNNFDNIAEVASSWKEESIRISWTASLV